MSDFASYEECISTSQFLHSEWIKVIISDCDNEAVKVSHIKLVHQGGRTALWNICTLLGVQSSGVPGQACQILEHYLHTLSVNYANIEDPTLRNKKIENVRKRIVLIITCCILLSSKMKSASIFLNTQIVRVCLLCNGIRLSVEDINVTELDIYTALKFKISLWNSYDITMFLASQAKFTPDKMHGIELIVDLAEYYKVAIESEVRSATCLPPRFRRNGGSVVRNLHLAAGAVAAAAGLSRSPDISKDLAALIKVPEIYIRCLCEIILNQISSPIRQQNNKPWILKRKWNFC